jgi:hypothetical protein
MHTNIIIKFSGIDAMTNRMIPGITGDTDNTPELLSRYAKPVREQDIGGYIR